MGRSEVSLYDVVVTSLSLHSETKSVQLLGKEVLKVFEA